MENKNRYEERMGTDAMLPLVIKMAMPAMAAQIVNLLYNLVDRIYIGHIPHIGTDALAGVGITTSVVILISAFSSIVGAGGAPLAAIALGQGDRKRAGELLGNGFTLLAFFTVLITFLSYLFMKPILTFAGASDNTLPYAIDYLSWYVIGTFFVQVTVGLNTFINSQGRPSIAMWSVVIGAIMNIILDPIFIFVFGMGVKGAAIATVISQACSAVWILHFLFSSKASLPLEKRYMKPKRKIIFSIVGLGIAPFVMASTESLIGFVLNGGLKEFGDIYISALAVMQSSLQVVSAPLVGFAQGFIPIVSYNYGHGCNERVKQCFRIVFTIMFTFNLVLIVLMMLFPAQVAAAFTEDPVLISTVSRYMPLFVSGLTIFGLQRACQNMFISLGQARISVFIALLRKVILLVPLALILPSFWAEKGIFAAEAIADVTAATCCAIIFAYHFPRILRANRNTAVSASR